MKYYTDIHSHVAWDVDDGIPSLEEAKKALQMAKDDNIRIIASTPHLIYGTTDLNEISQRQEELKKLAAKYNIVIRNGAELFMNRNAIEGIANGFLRPYEGTKRQLCEWDVRRDLKSIDYYDDTLYELDVRGYTPVIAHVERYFLNGIDLDLVQEWHDKGYIIQINRTSLQGIHGKTVKKNAWKLLDSGLAHIVATDTHRTSGSRVERLSDIDKEIADKYGQEAADLLLVENPKALLENKPIKDMPVQKKQKKLFSFLKRH